MQISSLVHDDLVARGKSVKTARLWRGWVDRFAGVCGEKDGYERSDVIRYLADLRERGFKQNTINVQLAPLKLLAQVQGWGFPKLAMRRVNVDEIWRPVFSKDEVSLMISRGKEVLMPRELAYLALSTTYGLRREEMCRLEGGELVGSIKVRTAKGGPVTTHIIPDELVPYLGGFRSAGVCYMSQVFQRIVRKVGVKANGGYYGWHSIRRALATELVLADASLLNIMRFMRWSEGSVMSELGMLALYARVSQCKVDEAIFDVHPFLPIWKGA